MHHARSSPTCANSTQDSNKTHLAQMGNNAAVALGLRYLHAILSSPLKAAGRQGRDWKPGFAPNTGAGQAPSSGAGLRFLPGKARREPGPPPPSLGATGFRPL